MGRRLFWYVLLRCLWIDPHFAVTKIRKRLRIANHRRQKRLKYQSESRRAAGATMRNWLPTTKGLLAHTRPGLSYAQHTARTIQRLGPRTVAVGKRVVRIGGVRPIRRLLHRTKKGVHTLLVWRKGKIAKRARRSANAPVERV
jgi:hypothetical protein